MYKLIIIGAGPAGLSASLFAKRYNIDHLIIGQNLGGAINDAHIIENYPGIKSISPKNLIKKFKEQITTEIRQESVEKIIKEKSKQNQFFKIKTNKKEYQAKALILAIGMKIRKLNFENEEKFINKGISYYVPDDISIFKNKTIAVVGGGDSALDTALKTSKQAKKVYLIHRRDEFRGAPILVKKVVKETNIEIVYSGQVKQAQGKKQLEKIILNNGNELKIDQLLIEIGGVPNIHLCKELNINMDGNFIKTDKYQATNTPGVFAAGDLTNGPLKLIVTAAAEGAIAATSAYKYLRPTAY
ncbi:MAG: NAD(P)/FAD-dependent oxidoreductase [Parcubacteria group bacterium]|nr:NAD(P)/FAD-dependent oxidoreductase [Parcubacteria group bacterium]